MPLMGRHNQLNTLAAIAAAVQVGVKPEVAIEAMKHFGGVKRRLEVKGCEDGVTVLDDFAHHPTAIRETIAALRQKMEGNARMIAVLEPRSNTMKMGTMKAQLPESLTGADHVVCYAAPTLTWDVAEAMEPLGAKVDVLHSIEETVEVAVRNAKPGDYLLVMSNGGFGGIHGKLLEALKARA
jgi:UDP-N-acetylmuramate: L-alanyl-gamma-D-glutamyl-meso-diaminopimelate ligase